MSQTSVNYKSVLEDLRAKRVKLDAAISAIEEMVGDASSTDSTHSEQPVRATAATSYLYSRSTIAEAAIHFLKAAGKPQGTVEIVNAIKLGGIRSKSKNLYRTVYNSLNTKMDKGQITKGGGKWGLTEWQNQQENPR
jgi:hypothetical protein